MFVGPMPSWGPSCDGGRRWNDAVEATAASVAMQPAPVQLALESTAATRQCGSNGTLVVGGGEEEFSIRFRVTVSQLIPRRILRPTP